MVHHLKDRWSVIIEDHVVQVAPAHFTVDDLNKRARWTGKFSGFSPDTPLADIFDCMSLSVDGLHVYRTKHDKLNVYVEFASEDKLNAAVIKTIYYRSMTIVGTPKGLPFSSRKDIIKRIKSVHSASLLCKSRQNRQSRSANSEATGPNKISINPNNNKMVNRPALQPNLHRSSTTTSTTTTKEFQDHKSQPRNLQVLTTGNSNVTSYTPETLSQNWV